MLYLKVYLYPGLRGGTPEGDVDFSTPEVNVLGSSATSHKNKERAILYLVVLVLPYDYISHLHQEIQIQLLLNTFSPCFHLTKKHPNTHI